MILKYKNRLYPNLFSQDWFRMWQWFLLIAINFPIKGVREEIRYRLGITIDRQIIIDRLLKNSFRIKTDKNQFQEVFYGKNVFALSVYRELMWLWKIIHKWDINFANNVAPKLNLGFDTLTAYSDAHPETNTFDGMVQNVTAGSTNWTTVTGAGTGTYIDDISNSMIARSYYFSEAITLSVERAGCLFNTSSLGDGSIESAVLSLFVGSKLDEDNDVYAYIRIGSFNPTLDTSISLQDFGNFGSIAFSANKDITSINIDGYTDFDLNTDGITAVNKQGITKLGIREGHDLAIQRPAIDTMNGISIFTADDATIPSRKPKFTVTYTSSTGWTGKILGITNLGKIMGINTTSISKVIGI
jgi:hypothetical protein